MNALDCNRIQLHFGDNRMILPTLQSASVDSIVCDPPYELGFMGKAWDSTGIAYDVKMWKECLRVLKPGGYLLAFGGSRTYHRMACAVEDAGFEIRDQIMWLYGSGFPKSHNLKGKHEGWGTALKPAHEPIVVARKPLIGSVQNNVSTFGTGALNIDGCRISTDGEALRAGAGGVPCRNEQDTTKPKKGSETFEQSPLGRWPANVIHDGSEEVLAAFPNTTSGKPVGVRGNHKIYGQGAVYGRESREPGTPVTGYGDSGSAARFFYCAKADRDDRDEGCKSLPNQLGGMVSNTSGQHITRRGTDYKPNPVHNNHPTVKPTNLMRYLCRLVTPAGGVVLDPFMGSGSTGKGAVIEGFSFYGIEYVLAHYEIAKVRIYHAARKYGYQLSFL